jgi:hypothetical protein
MLIRLLFALLGYVLKGVLSTKWECSELPSHSSRQSTRQAGGLGETAFHFLVAAEKLLERFRVLARNAARPRRSSTLLRGFPIAWFF